MNHHSLQVSHEEWLTFADDSLNNGFYSIAVKVNNDVMTAMNCYFFVTVFTQEIPMLYSFFEFFCPLSCTTVRKTFYLDFHS